MLILDKMINLKIDNMLSFYSEYSIISKLNDNEYYG